MKEKYIFIKGKQTNYTVTTNGKIYSLNYGRTGKKKELKRCPNKDTGYECVNIYYNKKLYRKYVHRLVAEAFIPNPYNKPEVNHKDGDITNNNITNREWATEKENTLHAFKHKLRHVHYGDDAPCVKINKKIAKEICKYLETNEYGIREIADILNVEKSIVANIKNKKAWIEVSKKYNIDAHNKRSKPKTNKKASPIKITEEDAEKICELLETDLSVDEISKMISVKKCKVNSILYGNSWRNVSKKYNFNNRRKGW